MTETIQTLIGRGNEIHIISGEGEQGTTEIYYGARTLRALRARLTRERAGGDRWARATIYSHSAGGGSIGVDIETGDYYVWHAVA